MKIGNAIIEVIQGDITNINTDAIVNAANPSLLGGGGVDGAIHRKAGLKLLEECKAIVAKRGRCPAGEAVITGAGNLPAKYVIHTVGPIWHGGNDNEPQLLRNAYFNSLKLAEENKIQSIAFPNISTGVYGYPKEMAAKEVKTALEEYLNSGSAISQILFACFDEENYNLYQTLFSPD